MDNEKGVAKGLCKNHTQKIRDAFFPDLVDAKEETKEEEKAQA